MGKLETSSRRIIFGLRFYYETRYLDNECYFIKITKGGYIYQSSTPKLYSDVICVYKKLKNYV